MAVEFVAPDFVSDNDPEDIQERMMNNLPEDIDDLPGGFPYDFTMPTALEKSELIQFHLTRTLMLMFPMWAWDSWLDLHASAAGTKRKEAGYASGIVTVTGDGGTRILSDIVFSTVATDEMESVEFSMDREEPYVIGDAGVVKIPVIAVLSGQQSNIGANTVTLLSRPVIGVEKVTNDEEMSGGTDTEDDESLRQRIQEVNESKGVSFVGNDGDYVRWAKEVVGVGTASVIPEWNGPGTVKLVVVDANGQPANEHMIDEVYKYVMSPDDRLQRKAPVGALLTVAAPQNVKIGYAAKIKLAAGYDMSQIITAFRSNLVEYYKEARDDGVIKYTKVASVLSSTTGVSDFENLMVNDGIINILLTQEQYPETDAVNLVQEQEEG